MGGAEVTTLSIIDALKKSDHQTTLYCIIPPNLAETKNFKIFKIPRTFPFLTAYQRMKKKEKLFKAAEKNELIIVSDGSLFLERTQVSRIILYCHSTFQDIPEFIKWKPGGLKGWYFSKIQNNLQASMEFFKNPKVQIVANSDYTHNEILKRFDKTSKVVYPPVDLKKYSQSFGNPKEKKIITVSRFTPEKNLEFAVEVANLTGLEHEIVGTAKQDYQVDLFRKLKQKAAKNVRLISNISSEELREKLGSAKVYFHPSKETFGIAVIEAISAGAIPVVPDNSAHPETVPFEELRFKNKEEAVQMLKHAVNGDYDHLRNDLRIHIGKFSVDVFQKGMLSLIN